MPSELRASFHRWVDLEVGSALDEVTVMVAPPSAGPSPTRRTVRTVSAIGPAPDNYSAGVMSPRSAGAVSE